GLILTFAPRGSRREAGGWTILLRKGTIGRMARVSLPAASDAENASPPSDASAAPAWLTSVRADERPVDYCLLPYHPLVPPEGKLPSAWVLAQSFALAEAPLSATAMIGALRDALGPSRTVWGIKLDSDGRIGWELYLYRNEHQHPDLDISWIASLLAPYV